MKAGSMLRRAGSIAGVFFNGKSSMGLPIYGRRGTVIWHIGAPEYISGLICSDIFLSKISIGRGEHHIDYTLA